MLMHYFDANDNEILVEINRGIYRELLQTKDGKELADAVEGSIIIHDEDPRRSALDNADVFFSYVNVASGLTTAAELLVEFEAIS